jgi:hypothetical protein
MQGGVDEDRGSYDLIYSWDLCVECAERIAKEIDAVATPRKDYWVDAIITGMM